MKIYVVEVYYQGRLIRIKKELVPDKACAEFWGKNFPGYNDKDYEIKVIDTGKETTN